MPLGRTLQRAFGPLGDREGVFPVAEQYAKEILSLPTFPELTEDQMDYVVDSIKEFYA